MLDDLRATRTGSMFVLSGPARPRSVVISTIRRLPPSRCGQERMVIAAEHAGQVGEDLVDLLGVGPRGQGRVLGTLQLGRGHELHRPGDLLDVPDVADAAPDIALTGHVLALQLGQEAVAELVDGCVE